MKRNDSKMLAQGRRTRCLIARAWLAIVAVVLLVANGSWAHAQGTIWMNPTTNDGSFEQAYDILSPGTAIVNSEDSMLRESGIWQYTAEQLDGTEIHPDGTGLPGTNNNFGFVEFSAAYGLGGSSPNVLFSDGTGNSTPGNGVSAFVDPKDIRIFISSDPLPIPGNPQPGETLNWSIDVNSLNASSFPDGHVPTANATLGIDFGNGVVMLDDTINATDGNAEVFEVVSGTYTLTAADLAGGTFSVHHTIANQAIESDIEGRLFSDNLTFVVGELVPGDVNNDGEVDLEDFNAIRDNFRTEGAAREDGDITGADGGDFGDGVVDFYDFIQWQENYPFPMPAGLSHFGEPVPEPATGVLVLVLVGLAGWKLRLA